ncbi:MAG: 6-phosphogluconolactonase, partial [Deltaproteobacteria bacterium]|nr:6-phosphogluconolactonase [Deltaproteobacteria bacterium]
GRFASPRLAIAGGSVVQALAGARGAKALRLTWVDERCVPFDDPDSNRGAAYRAGSLDSSRPPAIELPLFLDHESQAAAVERVIRQLGESFGGGLDVLLLGMGEDGHIASLFPGRAEALSSEPVVAVPDSPKPPPRRVSLTLATLATARHAVLLATGLGKRIALQRLSRADPALPASALSALTVVTDVHLGEQR